MPDDALLARIDRLESLDEIRQLAAKYSLALDMRDLDAMVNLFPEDVRVGKNKVGRAHFKQWMDETLRVQFTGTSHHIGNHIIEFEDPDSAVGVVYSKNEHETPTDDGGCEWVIMQMIYWDHYQRGLTGGGCSNAAYLATGMPRILINRLTAITKCAGPTETPTRARSTACSPVGRNFGQNRPLAVCLRSLRQRQSNNF